MKRMTGILALTLALGAGGAIAETDQTVTETDFRGAPPFKRERVSVKLTEPEAPRIDEIKLGDTLYEIDFSGKPPFKRDIVVVDEEMLAEAISVASLARFEEVDADADDDADDDSTRRAGPPGKSHIKP